MRGKATRCKNPVCGAVFLVEELPEAAPDISNVSAGAKPAPYEATPAQHWSGSVSDMVPILPAEEEPRPEGQNPPAPAAKVIPFMPASPVSGAPAQDAASWREPPPVRRSPGTPAEPPAAPARQEPMPELKAPPQAKTEAPRKASSADTTKVIRKASAPTVRPVSSAPTPTLTPSSPVEAAPGSWEPPPVRRGAEAGATPAMSPPETVPPASAPDLAMSLPRQSSRKMKWGVGLALAACVAAVATVLVLVLGANTQEKMFERAEALFAEGKYLNAFETYDKLRKDFPDSERKATYESLAELSKQLGAATPLASELEKTFAGLKGFCDDKANESLVNERKTPIAGACLVIAEDLVERANTNADTTLLKHSRDALALAERLEPTKQNKEKIAGLRQKILDREEQIAKDERIRKAKVKLAGLVGDPDAFEQALAIAYREFPELRAQRDVDELRRKSQEKYTKTVVWKQKSDKPAVAPVAEESEPSLVNLPSVIETGASFDAKAPVVFSLVRGVLYAQSQSNGLYLWSTRVGIDTTALPVRLPATAIKPERVLVLSSATNTLTARFVRDGRLDWSYDLESPCLGRPALDENRAYVSTLDGKVHVIEVTEGGLLGWYELGKRLTAGGVVQHVQLGADDKKEPKKYLYVPADERYIFQLDIADSARGQPCVAVILSGHPSGSLRSEPVVISREEQRQLPIQKNVTEWPDYLVLFQADDLKSMKMRFFHVPVQTAQGSLAVGNESVVPGWSWFPPYLDGEKIIQATDAGVIDVRGIQQRNNFDQPIFPELPLESSTGPAGPPGRAQIVHASEDDLWVLMKGELSLRHFNRYRQRIFEVWQRPLRLGSPVHASWVNEATKTAFVVTLDLDRPTCKITALDTSSDGNSLRWQRQLGLLCQGDPLVFNNSVVVLDESGSLSQFDPAKYPAAAQQQWPASGVALARPSEPGGRARYLLTGRGGKFVLAFADGGKNQFLIRKYEAGQKSVEHRVPTMLAGLPGVGDTSVTVAGADGRLWHVALDSGRPRPGPDWRSTYADRAAPGHVLQLGDNDYLVTNGFKGLARWHWPEGGRDFKKESTWRWPEGDRDRRQPPIPETAGRIVAPPVLLPSGADGDVQVVVVDARGEVTLLREAAGANEKTWTEVRTWKLDGKVSAGPLLRGDAVGFIVDNERLVWIDPKANGIRWIYNRPDEAIVGQPQMVGGLLLVAHRTGLFVGLDPATGKPLGPGYPLKMQTAPATAPVEFDGERAFAPLTDGTVLLLSLKHLRTAQVAASPVTR